MWPPAYFRVALCFIAAGWSLCDAVLLSREIESAAKLGPAQLVLAETNSVSSFSEFGDMRSGEVLKHDPGSSILSRSVQEMCAYQHGLAPSKPEEGQTYVKVAPAGPFNNPEEPDSIVPSFDDAALDFEAAFQDCYHKRLKRGIAELVIGVLAFLVAVSIQWFNEERSAKINVLISRGLSDCEHVDANDLKTDHRGKLVHVQGKTRAAHPIVDDRFPDARVTGCLRLQSTVEVCEWSRTARFAFEWSQSTEERRPSGLPPPAEATPRLKGSSSSASFSEHTAVSGGPPLQGGLPTGLVLGTTTKQCSRVELGAFVLTEDMVTKFEKFQPALQYLPPQLVSHGLTFFANTSDGYYYARPSENIPGDDLEPSPAPTLFTEPEVGDVRIRFLCVPEGEATVVAVQCEKEPGVESFVPYRPISRPSCPGDCCCCVSNFVADEIITEEIFYVSDSLESKQKPFQCVVRRSPCRVWVFRVFGWGILFVAILLLLLPFPRKVRSAPGLTIYGWPGCAIYAQLVLALISTLGCTAFIMACNYVYYKPFETFKWCCAVGVIIAAPLIYGTWT